VDDDDPRIGTELAGYRIESVIGRGGMGVVYLAEQLGLRRKVALKLLAPELAENIGFRERFEHESRAAAAIDHPNIIPLFDAAEAEGLLFLTMRYVEGIDLKALLEAESPMPLERVLDIVGQVANALDAAHARGLVHRDVKPGNVLIAAGVGREASDHCYLTDFGVTKDTSSGIALTAPGEFVGTIDYVAPEQIDGQPESATDQYALACMTFECLTGRPPYKGKSDIDTMYAHMTADPPSVVELRPDLPPGLDEVIAKAMAKSPQDRYETCSAMVAAARATLATTTTSAPDMEQTVVRPPPRDAGPGRVAAAAQGLGDAAPGLVPGRAAVARPGLESLTPPLADRAPAPSAAPARSGAGAIVIAAVIVVLAGLAGAIAGRSPEKGPGSVAAAGSLSLQFPAEWQTLSNPPEIRGLELSNRIAIGPATESGRQGLLAGRLASAGGAVLPAGLKAAATDRDAVRLGDVEAFRYPNMRPEGFAGIVTLYVVLTEAGREAIACYATPPSADFARSCAEVAGSVGLSSGEALTLAPSPAYAAAVGNLLTKMSADRTRGRRRLADASTSSEQARVATLLATGAKANESAARKLSAPPAARTANAAIVAAAGNVAEGYAAAASAARRQDASAYRSAGRGLDRASRALGAAARSLADLGYTVGS